MSGVKCQTSNAKYMPSSQTKILYLITLGEQGGAQKYVLDLAANLKNKYQIVLASGGRPNNYLQQQANNLNLPYYYLSRLQRKLNPLNDLIAFWQIFRLCRHYRPDIIHLNSSKAGALGALAAKLAGVKKVIYTVHGLVLNEPLSLKQKIFYWLAEWLSAKFKKQLICVSQADRQALLSNKIAPDSKITVIYNGLIAGQINFLERSNARRQLSQLINCQLTADDLLIGTVANLYPTKGLTYLIKAARQVNQSYAHAKFIVIGEGPRQKALQQFIHVLKLEKNFFLPGSLRQAANYLKGFDIFVLPSVKEGFPYTLLEAMAAQLPIIATYVGGVPEIIQPGYNGLLVPAADANALAQSINKLISDKKLRASFANAQSKLINQFNLSRTLQQTEKIYLA